VSLYHVGSISRTVADAAVMLQAIAGHDAKDVNSADVPVGDYLAALLAGPKPLRIGVPRKFFYEDLDPEVTSAVEQALDLLSRMSGGLREVEVDVPTDRTLQAAESYAYHAGFVSRSPELYQPETLRRIRSGEAIGEAELEQQRRELEQIRSEVHRVFEGVDVLATPTTPVPAPAIAELKENSDLLRPRELLLLRNTRPVNVWGLPAISVPCGFTKAGLPIGLQIIGPHWREDRVLQLAYGYEQATAWHKRQPKLSADTNE
jgi:Asp-tRNA(Asn)/Glu-tRNA(Gln) amidotransferase A subunit family amidase